MTRHWLTLTLTALYTGAAGLLCYAATAAPTGGAVVTYAGFAGLCCVLAAVVGFDEGGTR